MRKIILVISIFLFLLGCGDNRKEMKYDGLAKSKELTATQTQSPQGSGFRLANSHSKSIVKQNYPENRKIVWIGNLDFQVINVDESSHRISEICENYNGFISDMKLKSTPYDITNNIKIRVESSKFQELIEAIKSESIFLRNISISSNDVTEEYIDVETRLKSKKEVRKRYIEILKNKTGKIKDVIAAEEAIRNITEEIEAKEGRLRYLKDKVKFSTLNVKIYQEVDFVKEPSTYIKPYSEKALKALGNGWKMITGFTLFLFNIWPLVLFLSGLYIWKRKWLRKKMK